MLLPKLVKIVILYQLHLKTHVHYRSLKQKCRGHERFCQGFCGEFFHLKKRSYLSFPRNATISWPSENSTRRTPISTAGFSRLSKVSCRTRKATTWGKTSAKNLRRSGWVGALTPWWEIPRGFGCPARGRNRQKNFMRWFFFTVFVFSRIWNFPRFQFSRTSDFPDFNFLGFEITHISNFPDFKFPRFQISQISNFPDFKLPRFQISQISNFPHFRFPALQISIFPDFTILGF